LMGPEDSYKNVSKISKRKTAEWDVEGEKSGVNE